MFWRNKIGKLVAQNSFKYFLLLVVLTGLLAWSILNSASQFLSRKCLFFPKEDMNLKILYKTPQISFVFQFSRGRLRKFSICCIQPSKTLSLPSVHFWQEGGSCWLEYKSMQIWLKSYLLLLLPQRCCLSWSGAYPFPPLNSCRCPITLLSLMIVNGLWILRFWNSALKWLLSNITVIIMMLF